MRTIIKIGTGVVLGIIVAAFALIAILDYTMSASVADDNDRVAVLREANEACGHLNVMGTEDDLAAGKRYDDCMREHAGEYGS